MKIHLKCLFFLIVEQRRPGVVLDIFFFSKKQKMQPLVPQSHVWLECKTGHSCLISTDKIRFLRTIASSLEGSTLNEDGGQVDASSNAAGNASFRVISVSPLNDFQMTVIKNVYDGAITLDQPTSSFFFRQSLANVICNNLCFNLYGSVLSACSFLGFKAFHNFILKKLNYILLSYETSNQLALLLRPLPDEALCEESLKELKILGQVHVKPPPNDRDMFPHRAMAHLQTLEPRYDEDEGF